MVRGLAREIVLIDAAAEKAAAEAMDLMHGSMFVPAVDVYQGNVEDCRGAAVVVITAGAKQKPGQTRLDPAEVNAKILAGLLPSVLKVAPAALVLIVSNPVDVLTYIAGKISSLPTYARPTYSSGEGSATFSVAVADVNEDGRPDVLVANRCPAGSTNCSSQAAGNGTVGVLINTAFSDVIPPTTLATLSPGPNAKGWNNANVTVTLNATDNPGGSGVKQVQFALNGAGWHTVAGGVASVVISAEGTTTLSYFATDNAGNQESAKTLTVRIDKTPPAISGLPATGCTIWPPNHKLVQVATVTAMDALSGFAPGSFTVTATSNDPKNGAIVITGGPNQFNVQLGADKGQVYTLTAMASDLAGNTRTSTAMCTVPHDQGH